MKLVGLTLTLKRLVFCFAIVLLLAVQSLFLLLWLCLSKELLFRYGLRRIHLLVTAEFIMSATSFLVWHRCSALIRKFPTAGGWPRDLLKSFLILFLLASHGCISCHFFLLQEEPHWLSLFSMTCAGFYMYLTMILFICLFIEAVTTVGHLCGRTSIFNRVGSSEMHTFMALCTACCLTIWSLYAVSRGPVVKMQTVTLARLSHDFEGFRIVLLTDVHIGPTVGRSQVMELVNTVNGLSPGI